MLSTCSHINGVVACEMGLQQPGALGPFVVTCLGTWVTEHAVLHPFEWQALYKLSSDSRGVVRGCTEEMCETSCPAVDITGACEVMLAAAFAVSVAMAGAQPTAWA